MLPSHKGFAVNLHLLVSRTEARMDPDAKRGYLESSLLERLVTVGDLEPRANSCTEVK